MIVLSRIPGRTLASANAQRVGPQVKRGAARRLGLRRPNRKATGGVISTGQVYVVGEHGPYVEPPTTYLRLPCLPVPA